MRSTLITPPLPLLPISSPDAHQPQPHTPPMLHAHATSRLTTPMLCPRQAHVPSTFTPSSRHAQPKPVPSYTHAKAQGKPRPSLCYHHAHDNLILRPCPHTALTPTLVRRLWYTHFMSHAHTARPAHDDAKPKPTLHPCDESATMPRPTLSPPSTPYPL